MPTQNATTILKPLVPNPHSTPFTHHVADCVAPFPCSQHSPPPPLKFLNTPPSHPPLLTSHTWTRVRGNCYHHKIRLIKITRYNVLRKLSRRKRLSVHWLWCQTVPLMCGRTLMWNIKSSDVNIKSSDVNIKSSDVNIKALMWT